MSSAENGAAWAKGLGTIAKGVESTKALAKSEREADEPEHNTGRAK